MRLPQARVPQYCLIGVGLVVSLICLGLFAYLTHAERTRVVDDAARAMAIQADGLARQIEADLVTFDLALRETTSQPRPRDSAQASAKASLLDLPLMTRYLGFINVLNEAGDVIADAKSTVSRPVNFAGRDYFQDHVKNAGDILMIGRPFAMAPTQHASIPLSRRLTRSDGGFDGVVVAGVRLAWLSDLLSLPSPGPRVSATIRREDGVILMRTPPDNDAIGRSGASDHAWQTWLRDGASPVIDASTGMKLFRRLAGPPLVLELELARDDIAPNENVLLPWLTLAPGLFIVALSFLALHLRRLAIRAEAGARVTIDERMQILGDMSHELRTQLFGIMGQADLLTGEGGLNDPQRSRLTAMTDAVTLTRTILDRITDLARPEDRATAPVPIACDLDSLIRSCLGVVEAEAKRKRLRLHHEMDLATPRHVKLAPDHVRQVLINLLMNAVKYTREGAVTLRVSGNAAKLRFEVADTGPGVPTGKWHRLFRAYDRLDRPSIPGSEGTGLGLSISERLVRQMKGRLGHSKNPGGGSVFWVELPTEEAAAPSPPAESTTPVVAPVRHRRVLLADDLDLTRSVTAEYLRAAGHVVIEVRDGEAALAELQSNEFDVVLADMRMPVVDGRELARRILALPRGRKRTPVILVTADLAAIGQGASPDNGIDACLAKPFTRNELLSLVASVMARAALPSETRAAFDDRIIDPVAFADLRATLGEPTFATQLSAAAVRIEALITLLERRDTGGNQDLDDAVHDLTGVSGLFGLTALSSCLLKFDTQNESHAAPLKDAATSAVTALRERRTMMSGPTRDKGRFPTHII